MSPSSRLRVHLRLFAAINQFLTDEFPVFPVVKGTEHLKDKLHSKLNVTRTLSGEDASKGGRAEENIRQGEIGMIEKIEELETELQ